jgi:CheY-like chemotaxis protein
LCASMDAFRDQAILLAEDSESDVALMKEAFIKAGVSNPLYVVSGGEQAIAYLKREAPYTDPTTHRTPFVLLLDLNMPGKSGFEVLEWVRQQPTLKRLVIIILTASNRAVDADRAYELGANFYLTKPGQFKELVEMTKCLHGWLQLNHFPNR